jgi:signal transduction histidine kinase
MKTKLRNLTLKQRLLFLPIFSLLGLIVLQLANSYTQGAIRRQVVYPSLETVMMSGYKSSLKSLVDAEAQTLGARLKTLKTRGEQTTVIVEETDPIRFFDDGSGYFFTYDMDGIRVNVPINKSGNGKNMRGLLDSHGYPFVQAFIDQAKAGGGFVTYYFDKEGYGVQPKLSYAKLIPGSDIFIGTGIYIDTIEVQRMELAQRITSQEHEYLVYVSGIFLLILIATVTFTLLLSRSVTRTVGNVVSQLLESSEQVASASGELSTQSQSLAQGASRQAATIQETTASLQEISGSIRHNTESARKADEVAEIAKAAAERGSTDMQAMSAAISAMNDSSRDISKIIKTIDEIAFQTNILALNAAVEAARAGEAGMGFAVVADEVRSLALRSAQASRETTEKLEAAITKTANGVGLSSKVADSLQEISVKVRQVVGVAEQVASASAKQAENIDQISAAMGVMNQVTQSTAANAEESAASAQQLNAQAYSMKENVSELRQLVGAATQGREKRSHVT